MHDSSDTALPGRERQPASAWICDLMVLAYAAWTLLCNAVVFSGGSLNTLLAWSPLAPTVLVIGYFLLRRRAQAREPDTARQGCDLREALDPPRGVLGWARFLVPALLTVGFLWRASAEVAWWLALLYLGWAAWRTRPTPDSGAQDPPARRSLSWEVAIWILAAGAALLPLFHQVPSVDDAYYVNVAVAAIDHPEAPLLEHDTLHGVPEQRLMFSVYRLHSFELLAAAIAKLSGLKAIEAAHWVVPSLFGAFLVLAYAQLLRRLTPRTWLWSLLAALACLLLVEDSKQSFGSFSLARFHQGKAVLLCVILPLLIHYGLRFCAKPSLRGWILLAAVQVAGMGMSSTALWLCPLVALFTLLAATYGTRRRFLTLVLGSTASIYLVAAGLSLHGATVGEVRTLSTIDEGVRLVHYASEGVRDGTRLLMETWKVVLGSGPMAILSLFVCLSAWTFCRTRTSRRVAAVFTLGALLFLLNPYLAAQVAHRVTGDSTYWRVLWVLPIPAFLGIFLTTPLAARLHPAAGVGLSALLAAAVLVFLPRGYMPRQGIYEFMGLKVMPDAFAAARILKSAVPRGSNVLASRRVAFWVPTLHEHPYPLVVRQNYLEHLRERLGPEEFNLRTKLYRYISGDPVENGPTLLRRGIRRLGIAGIVFRRWSRQAPQIREVLVSERFQTARVTMQYEIWVPIQEP